MAHFVLINLGLHGHINPTLAMAHELITRGNSLSYFAPEEFGPAIRETGAEFYPYRSVFSQPVSGFVDAQGRTPMPVRLITDCLQAIPQILEQVSRLNPDAILFDVMCLQGRIIAEVLKKPAIRLSSTFVLNEHITWKPKAASDPTVLSFTGAAIEKLCADLNVAPFRFQDIFSRAADLNVVFTLRQLQPQQETFDRRFVFVGAGVDAEIKKEISRGSPPFVYVALGTLANNRPDFYLACIEGLQKGLRKKALIAVGSKTDLSQLQVSSSDIDIVRHAPQLQALKSADVFVSHGGMNSLMEALSFGVPMVLFPQTEEQVVNAELLSSLGVAIHLKENEISAVGSAVETILEEEKFWYCASALREQVHSSGGFMKAADCIEDYVKHL